MTAPDWLPDHVRRAADLIDLGDEHYALLVPLVSSGDWRWPVGWAGVTIFHSPDGSACHAVVVRDLDDHVPYVWPFVTDWHPLSISGWVWCDECDDGGHVYDDQWYPTLSPPAAESPAKPSSSWRHPIARFRSWLRTEGAHHDLDA